MNTRNLSLKYANFDFNNTDMAFIQRTMDSQYSPAVRKLVTDLRDWLRFRQTNPKVGVFYEVKSDLEDGVIKQHHETGIISFDGECAIDLVMSKVHQDTYTAGHTILPNTEEVMHVVGIMFDEHNKFTDREHNSALSAVRPLLRNLSDAAIHREVSSEPRGQKIEFVLADEGSVYLNVFSLYLRTAAFVREEEEVINQPADAE